MTATAIAGIVCLWFLAMMFLFFGWDTLVRSLHDIWRVLIRLSPPYRPQLRPESWVIRMEIELLDTPIDQWITDAVEAMPVLASDGRTMVEIPPVPRAPGLSLTTDGDWDALRTAIRRAS